MLIWVLVGVALAVTVAVGAATWPVGPARRAQMADKFARDVDLALSPELVPVVGERLVRRGRLAVMSVGLAAAFMLSLVSGAERPSRAPGVPCPSSGSSPSCSSARSSASSPCRPWSTRARAPTGHARRTSPGPGSTTS